MPASSPLGPLGDWRVVLLRLVLRAYGWLQRKFRWLKFINHAFYCLYLSVSPSIPVNFNGTSGPPRLIHLFWISFGITLFFCAGVTAVLCALEGTLIGSAEGRIYFLKDIWNLTLYLFVCPAYVGICCCLIAICIDNWSTLTDYADSTAGARPQPRGGWRICVVIFFSLLLCTGYIVNYMNEVLHPVVKDGVAPDLRIYWFMAQAGAERTLNKVGYYYLVMNFALLFTILLGASCFLSLTAEVMRCGMATDVDRIEDFDHLAKKLAAFTRSYLLTKALVACLVVNTVVWYNSPLGKAGHQAEGNMLAAKIYLTLIGFYFLAVPRQYLELKWYELWQASGRPFEFASTRSEQEGRWATLLDVFFIGGMLSWWNIDVNGVIEFLSNVFEQGTQ